MSLQFLVVVHRVPISADFTLNDLAGSGGRMDAIANSVTAAFLYSNHMRRDTRLSLLMVSDPNRPIRVSMDGSSLRNLNPDERSTAALVKNAIQRYWGARAAAEREGETPAAEIETSPGILVSSVDPVKELLSFAQTPGALWLTEEGGPFPTGATGEAVRVVLSDPYDLTPEEAAVLSGAGIQRVSLGPLPLHSAQCITIVHNMLDRQKS